MTTFARGDKPAMPPTSTAACRSLLPAATKATTLVAGAPVAALTTDLLGAVIRRLL
jgi:hypothetical protein